MRCCWLGGYGGCLLLLLCWSSSSIICCCSSTATSDDDDNDHRHNHKDNDEQQPQQRKKQQQQLAAVGALHRLLLAISKATTMGWPEWLQPHIDSFVQWVNGLLEYWHLGYLEYLVWLLLPIFVVFILPVVLMFFSYGCVIFLRIYKHRNRIREAYASSVWDGARASIASFWEGVGYLWHGYEIDGLDNIPDEGPGMIVAYHGPTPLDLYYVIAKGILYKKRTIHCVADKFVFKIPGWSMICKVFCMTPGTVEDCVATLRQGHLLIIAPGGVREALFSNPVTYELMWGRRLGFAKVVLGSGVPVIPMFTENCREAFRTPRWARRLARPIYERTRLPLCPIYGGFPVKMITHLGTPLTFDCGIDQQMSTEQINNCPADQLPVSAEHIKRAVRDAVDSLIQQHQRLPGSICRAMFQRVRTKRSTKRRSATDTLLLPPDSAAAEEARNRWRRQQHLKCVQQDIAGRQQPWGQDDTGGGVTVVTDESTANICAALCPAQELAEVPLLMLVKNDAGRHQQQQQLERPIGDGEALDQE